MTSIGKPLVCGRSADIHAWRDGYLLKLYHAGFGRVHAQREANRTGIALAAGIVVPEVLELVTLADRHGLVLRKVPGPTLLQALVRSPGDASSLARRFAELHASIHACRASGLPEQRVLLERLIPKASDVEDALKRLALLSLQAASTEAVLCHGDFHPMNIILAPDGPVILDWYKASRGDPALDVARTLMVINMVPVSRRQANDPRALQAARETFSRAY
jgi:thiamine kinase-like enzyme